MIAKPQLAQPQDFSLVLGGPLYQLLLRSRLVQPPFGKLSWRIGIISGLAWLPLVPLTILSGRFSEGVRVPFLYDFEVHSRLLLALPLLILAELVVYVRMRAITSQFVERHIIGIDTQPAFDAVVAAAMRLRNSAPIELALLAVTLLGGPMLWQATVALHLDTWYATTTTSGFEFTPAGWWYGFVSVPVFQFILLRWYYRLFIWFRFLFQVSRLELTLLPTHPDRCCGLGFLGNIASAFAPLLMAHSAVVSGYVANRIIHEGAKLPDFKIELLSMGALLLFIVLGPLCVFTPKLNQARLAGLRSYGRLASDYVAGFASKWTDGVTPSRESLLGSADIQSLADLDNSFSIIREMRLVPFGKDTLLRFIVVITLPVAPLALTMFSAEELLKRLLSVML